MGRKIIPVSGSVRIEAEIRQFFDEVVEGSNFFPDFEKTWIPSLDIFEREEYLLVEMELPGIEPKDMNILLHPNRLEIWGTKKKDDLGNHVKYFRMEREYGPFRCCVFLPYSVKTDKVEAIMENGVLNIRLKKDRQGKKEVAEKKKELEEMEGR